MPFDVGTAVGYLDLNTTGWNKGMSDAQSKLSGFNGQMSNAQSAWTSISKTMSSTGLKLTAAVTTPIVGLGTKAVKTASTFESAMSQVQATMGVTVDSMSTLDGQTVNTMGALSDLAKELGSSTKFSAVEAAEAINNMAMAGYSVQEIYNSLPQVLSLASAGALDLDYATQLVANGLNVMGMGTEDATELADKLAVVSTKAYGSVSDFGEGLLVAGAQAKLTNTSLTDTVTALGILGDNGISASESGTYLRNTLKNLYTPTEKAADALLGLGVTTANSDGTLKDFQTVLQELGVALDGLTEDERVKAMSNIFDSRTISAANALIKNSGERWDELSESIDGAAGSAKTMADTQLHNLDGQLTILKSSLEGLAIAFGSLIMPVVKEVTGVIQGIVDYLNSLDEAQKEQIIQIAAIVAAIGPALLIMGKVMSAISGISSAMSLLLSPVGAVIAIIAALVAAFIYLWDTNEDFRQSITETWEKIKNAVQGFFDGILELINSFGFEFGSMTEAIEAAWDWLCNLLAPVFEGAFSIISDMLGGILHEVMNLLNIIVALVQGDWTAVWEGVKQFFTDLWNDWISLINDFLGIFGTSIEEIWNSITEFFAGIWNSITEFFADIWNSIVEFFTNIVNWIDENLIQPIVQFFVDLWDGIKAIFEPVAKWVNENVIEPVKAFFAPIVEWFTQLFTNIWNYISSVFEAIAGIAKGCWEIIKAVWGIVSTWFNTNVIQPVANFFTGMWESIKTAASAVWNFIKNVWSAVSGWFSSNIIKPIGNFFSGMWDKLKQGAKGAWEGIKNVFSSVTNWFKDIFSKAWQKVKDVFSAGGKVFSGIKEGIENTFKKVVNAIIGGINTVVAVPFNAINKFLSWLRGISIVGITPFSGISLISVPQIPLLAKGGVLKRGQVGLLEGDGTEAVVPLEKNTEWIRRVSSELFEKFKVLLSDSGLLKSLQTFAVSAEQMIQSVKQQGTQPQKTEATINNTYNFYSPKEIDPIQARKMMMQTAQQLALD